MTYRPAIIKAIEDLKDLAGSSSVTIRTYIQNVILLEDKKWVNSLYLRALKDMSKCGDLVENNMLYKLSPQMERKRAEAFNGLRPRKISIKEKEASQKKKAIPAKKTLKAKPKLETSRSKKNLKRIEEINKRMEIRHEFPEPGTKETKPGEKKPDKYEQEDKKKKRSATVFSPKIKAEKAAMKTEKIPA